MQSDPIITVENLGKRYQLGAARQGERYTALRDVVARSARNLLRRGVAAAPGEMDAAEEFWALRDVSFQIGRGEVVGIIGRNGAGKSTLLKVLSRITDPTQGRITLRGRVASLLEVGTGFHPELTGRENIYLNGAILGMHRREIKAKFDEIVAFAEVEKFLDTPVKRYSSGMYVRLAFAVAAHLEPEILIVDEVLAVGDAEFQKKCLGKMSEVAHGGRTVLFVSHNMGAVRALCSRGIFLRGGRVMEDGSVTQVVNSYLQNANRHVAEGTDLSRQRRCGSEAVTIRQIRTLGRVDGAGQDGFFIGEPVRIALRYQAKASTRGTFFVLLSNADGDVVLSSFQKDNGLAVPLELEGKWMVELPALELLPGPYSVSAGILDENARDFFDWVEHVVDFEVLPRHPDGRPYDQRFGLVSVKADWTAVSSATLAMP